MDRLGRLHRLAQLVLFPALTRVPRCQICPDLVHGVPGLLSLEESLAETSSYRLATVAAASSVFKNPIK